ncbi:uncharacterized protein LOC133736840 isoform X2 [Rosa rugosa]|nr:uncharacterized protein LOC133736840 isoform X2 [Rosa rugosa]
MLGSLVDRFIGWALPLLSNISAGDGTAELALDGLREFLNVGDVGGIEIYALSILKACQVLLEDERTSLSLLHRLLGVLTLISLKFSRYFQPHFLDIVDLLLGWALVPDLAESDRRIIMDSFLQFQNHWVGSLQFSLGLLSKFVGDMDVLIQDVSHGTPQQFRRLLALLSCFSTVLQSTASGLLEMKLLEQITEPLNRIIPRLLGCLSMVGRKFGWLEWIGDSWKCLTLLAEIFCERFSTFYALAVDILFQSLEVDNSNQAVGTGRITSFQVHGVLKTNLQLLSLQKSGLLPISVQKILQFDAPISQLRLHPNHLVTGSSAATYIFLLQHGNNEVVEQALTSLTEELELLKGMLENALGHDDGVLACSKTYSKRELFALIKFDLKVLLSCVFFSGGNSYSLIGQPDIATLYLMRSEKLVEFIIEKFNPFDLPIMEYVDLQVSVLKTFDRLTVVKFLSTCSLSYQSSGKSSMDVTSNKLLNSESLMNEHSVVVVENLRKYSLSFVKALHISSPLAVKVTALDWVQRFCENVIAFDEKSDTETRFYEVYGQYGNDRIIGNMLYSIMDAASDREPKVLAITEDLHDVHSLGKEAAAVHRSLVEDLSKANAILLPLETVLSKDVAAMTDAVCRDRETNMEISPIHGQAIYQSYSLKIREACQTLHPLVPSLTSSVKGLYSMLTGLARTASLHAGDLHKALEGLGESQEVESPVTDVSRPDLATDAAGFDDKERENLSMSNSESIKDFVGIGLPLEDKGWLSPPDSICSSSTDSGISLPEMSLPVSFNDQEDIKQQLLHGPGGRDAIDFQNTTPYSQADSQEMLDSPHRSKFTDADNTHVGSFKLAPSDLNEYQLAPASPSDDPVSVRPDTSRPSNENREVVFGGKDEISSLNKVIIKDETCDATHASSRVGRGKNPYAMSVLRRVEMKLDGRDISENREISISEQVGCLLKQAPLV